MSIDDIKFSQMQTFGDHLYRSKGEVAEIIFTNERTGLRKTIVDNSGWIMDFSGVAHQELISRYYEGRLREQITFSSYITLLDGQYALIWQIQPDGRYWEDEDGFGGTSDDEINLYARIDEAGSFIEPFRLFSIGGRRFYGTDAEEKAAKTLATKEDPLTCLQREIPGMLDEIKKRIMIPETVGIRYSIPGTIYQMGLALNQESGKWFVRASMQKVQSSRALVGFLGFLPLEEMRAYLQTEKAKDDAVKEVTHLFDSIQRKD